jgi:hypothetical protein
MVLLGYSCMSSTGKTITLPKGCTGMTMADGTRYNSHNHRVTLEGNHADAFKKDGNYDYIGGPVNSMSDIPTRPNECSTCGFNAWPWQKMCPRCSRPTHSETEETLCPVPV